MRRPPAPSPEPNAFRRKAVFCPKITLIGSGMYTGKVQVIMGLSELVLIALVGLAVFGGAININFKGVFRRSEGRELQDGEPTPTRKRLGGNNKKPGK